MTLPWQQTEPKRKRTRRELPPTTWAEDVLKQPVTWAVPGYFPRRIVSLIAGPRDAGKTLFAVWLAAEASRGSPPLRVWLNSQEDDLATVLRPRIDAATDHLDKMIRLTAEHWRLPEDLKKIRAGLAEHEKGGAPDDILILDSIQQHVTRPYWLAPARETMLGLIGLAREFDIAVLTLGHTTKGKHGSVTAMIEGHGVLQNLAKAIFIFGAQPGARRGTTSDEDDRAEDDEEEEESAPRHVLACERLGIAPKPPAMLFGRLTKYDSVTRRGEPYLRALGPSNATAREVLDEAKADDRGGDDGKRITQAVSFIRQALAADGPMTTKDLEKKAKAAGSYGSERTFNRARKSAGIEGGWRGRAYWVWLEGQEPPA
jgi:AAA domain